LNRLRKAEAAFCKLATETERPDELRQYWRIWQLACLANDLNRQEEAKAFCHALLEENHVSTKAIIWAIARNYGIDLIASQRALESVCK
jgi:predicted DsbA family dithiol-disulfide isomerase